MIVTVMNQKGGVGKTTTVANLGHALAQAGQRVLLVDFDPQANLTQGLGLDDDGPTIYEAMLRRTPLADTIRRRDGLAVVPSRLAFAEAEFQLAGELGKEMICREILADVGPSFDLVLMDVPPSLGFYPLSALIASDRVLVPVQAGYYALEGVAGILRAMASVRQRFNAGLGLWGILVTQYDSRKRIHQDVLTQIRLDFGEKVLRTVIRQNVALEDCPSHGLTVFEYRPASYGAVDYRTAARELLEVDRG